MFAHRKILISALLCVALAGPASAVSFPLVTYENADDANLVGLDLWFEVTDEGSHVDFTFYNSSTIASNVANIYFESSGAGLNLGAGSIHAESDGVAFSAGGSPNNPAPGADLGWAGTLARFRAQNPAPHKGIGNTLPSEDAEWLTIRFGFGSTNFSSLTADLASGEFRVAQHVTGMPQSIWTESGREDPVRPVPLPASVWLMGSGLLGWVSTHWIRRRR